MTQAWTMPVLTTGRLTVAALLLLCLTLFCTTMLPVAATPRVLEADAVGYHAYLPALLIDRDLSLRSVIATLERYRYPALPPVQPYRWSGLLQLPASGGYIDQYPSGVALLALPCFLVAHLLALAGGWPADGFSVPYQWGAGLSGIIWLGIGLFATNRLLVQAGAGGQASLTLTVMLLGTNLLYYGVYAGGFSHVYSFALIALLLASLPSWYRRPTTVCALRLALLLMLIGLVRQSNLLVGLVLPAYVIAGGARRWHRRARAYAAGLLLCAVLPLLGQVPQLLLWRLQAGEWLLTPYALHPDVPAHLFTFTQPYLREVLLSVRKGLFFWSPVLLFGVAGWLTLRGPARIWRLPLAAALLLHTWLVASYYSWFYAASFGHRGFTDLLVFFALPLGLLLQATRRPRLRLLLAALLLLLCLLTQVQVQQYRRGIISGDGMTWPLYRAVFLRLDLPSLYGV